MRDYPEVAIQIPDVLIPNESVSREKWAVVACDQYTSQPDYWEKVRQIAHGAPSTYHLILPEAFLGKTEEVTHQSQINPTMVEYLNKGLFQPVKGLIYVERSFGSRTRQGLITALDLEHYDFHKESQSLIRATEDTIIERLPPRIKIRENAPLEIPHILVLIDDPLFTVIEPLSADVNSFQQLYDFELMQGGGLLRGYLINRPDLEQKIISALENLAHQNVQEQKYQQQGAPLLYAVGDGNHSLAAAKSLWEKNKPNSKPDHPSRFALVEIVNIHNQGIVFEPIHRLISKNSVDILEKISSSFSGKVKISKIQNFNILTDSVKSQKGNSQLFGSISGDEFHTIDVLQPLHTLTVGSLQFFLDNLLKDHPDIGLDFIHGDDALLQLANQTDTVGFYLPAMEKSRLFKSVIKDGPLPRKTFSMGEAHEKRFYFECRKIQAE